MADASEIRLTTHKVIRLFLQQWKSGANIFEGHTVADPWNYCNSKQTPLKIGAWEMILNPLLLGFGLFLGAFSSLNFETPTDSLKRLLSGLSVFAMGFCCYHQSPVTNNNVHPVPLSRRVECLWNIQTSLQKGHIKVILGFLILISNLISLILLISHISSLGECLGSGL